MKVFTNLNQVIALVLFFGLGTMAYSQESHQLLFQSGTLPEGEIQKLAAKMQEPEAWMGYAIGGYLYCIIQYDALPDELQRDALAHQGISLLDYLPDYAYLARVPQSINPGALGVRAVLPLLGSFKISRPLLQELSANPDRILALRVLPLPGIAPIAFVDAIQEAGFAVQAHDAFSIFLEINAAEVPHLASHPAIYFLEIAPAAPAPEGERANALMSANWQSQAPNSNYNGSGVVIGIGDDGTVNHTDLKGRVISMTNVNWGTHGDMTVGIAAGVGNINPLARGLAPGATIHLSLISGYPQIQHAEEYLQNYGTIVTSTSYGESCGGYYSSSTQFIDHQVYSNAYLMHCFSAGNSSSSGCSSIYGQIIGPDGKAYGNITGGQKAGKNVVAVGNVTFGDILSPSSSRGPAEDGRIKPDLCAIAQGSLTTDADDKYRFGSGTSAASPAIAGIYAVLVQAYRNLHNGQNPPSALLKGTLLNTAEDLGRPGPDYEYGWGRVNGRRALGLIEQQQYQTGLMPQGALHSHSIYVPAGTKEMRVMLYWHDPAASPLAAKALVNDLDLSLQGPNNAIYLPHKLSTFPHIDSLTKPAYAGIDRVNNMEQVVLKNPAPGLYNARAFGHLIPQGPQAYFLVYAFIQEELAITYPRGGEQLSPGQNIDLFWEAVGNQSPFTLQYSINGGQNWISIASNVAGHLRHFAWTAPTTATSQARFRISRAGTTVTGGDFTILNTPDFHITATGSNTARIFWEPVNGAVSYDVHAMGTKFMEVIAATSGTSIDLPAPAPAGNWYSVSARHAGGGQGRRAYAKFYQQHPCQSEAVLSLKLDGNPGQVSWKIFNQAGNQLASGGPYSDALANQLITIPLCLPQGCHVFSIYDSGNNGLCCSAGQGYFQLHNAQGQLLASGSSFGASSSANFCLQAGQASLQASITASPSTSCHDISNGWAIVFPSGGTGNYSFAWSNGATTQQISGLAAGSYQVTVSDGNASIVASVDISQPSPMDVGISIQVASCGNTASGQASAIVSNGTPPFSYQWSNGATTPTIANLLPGDYSLTVTDVWGCTQTAIAQVQAGSTPAISLGVFSPNCSYSSDGSIFPAVVGGSGSYAYQWSNGSTLANLINISPGLYGLTVTDSNGCTQSASANVAGPPPLLAQATIGADGQSVSIAAQGGLPPYHFLWPDGSTGNAATMLTPGSYLVTITDANACTTTVDFEIVPLPSGGCISQGSNAAFNWIEQVQLGNIIHQSGNNGGYASFAEDSALQLAVESGQSFNLSLWPGYFSNTFQVNWSAWIDLNDDGDFEDAGEHILPVVSSSGNLSFTLSIPAGTAPGPKLLRIAMAFGITPLPCEGFVYGEVEDYTILVTAQAIEYCISAGLNTSFEWIEHVTLGSLSNTSGNDGGYGDYSNLILSAAPGETIPFALQPGYNNGIFPESWSIWIDYNQDGQLAGSQELVFSQAPVVNTVSGQFLLSAALAQGEYRLRIVMRWSTSFSGCGLYGWGETEDYTLLVVAPVNPLVQGKASSQEAGSTKGHRRSSPLQTLGTELGEDDPVVFPNPAGPEFSARFFLPASGQVSFQLYDVQGRLWDSRRRSVLQGWSTEVFAIERLPRGVYFLAIKSEHREWVLSVIKT
jgi:hypothetical protein